MIDHHHIQEAEERLRQAMLHSDVQALKELIAPELIFTTHYGQRVSKEEDLATHRQGILRLTELTPSQTHVHIHVGFAVVSVLMHVVGQYQSVPFDLNLRYTRIWAATPESALHIVAGHASPVEEVLPDE